MYMYITVRNNEKVKTHMMDINLKYPVKKKKICYFFFHRLKNKLLNLFLVDRGPFILCLVPEIHVGGVDNI